MMREALGLAVTGWLLTGCGSTLSAPAPAAPTLSQAQQCMRGGGWWRESLGLCEVQGTGPESGRH